MFIENLKIKNFRNIAEADLEFRRVNLILGKEGEGKSSILNSIVYLLLDHLELRIQDYVRWGQSSFHIESEFKHLSDKYNYKIKGDKTAKKELKVSSTNDILINSDATNYLKDIIDPILTLYSNVSLQGETSQLLSDKPTPRLQKLRTIFGLEGLQDSGKNIKFDIDENKRQLEILKSELNILENKQFTYHDLPELEDITGLHSQLELLEEKRKTYLVEKDLYSEYVSKKEKYESAISEISKYEEELKDKKNILANFLKQKISIAQKEIDDQEKELDECRMKRIGQCDYSEKDIKDIQEVINDFKVKVKEKENKLKIIQSGKCDKCGAEYSEGDTKDLQDEISILKRGLSTKQDKFKEVENIYFNYIDAKHENEKIKLKRSSILNRMDSYVRAKNEIEEKYNLYKDFIYEEVAFRGFSKNDFNTDEAEKTIITLETKIEELRKVEEPEKVDNPNDFDHEGFESIKNKIILHEQKTKEKERLQEINDKTKEEEEENSEKIEDNLYKVEFLQKENRILTEARKVIEKEFSGYLISNGTEYIKQRMNEFFNKVYGKYNLIYENDGKGISFKYSQDMKYYAETSSASGFEKDIISIANRMALASIQDLKILFLDEIDRYASTGRAIELFDSLLKEDIEQFFIISHNPTIQEFIENQPDSKVFEVHNGVINKK